MKTILVLVAIVVCAGTGWSVYQSSIAATQTPERAPKDEVPVVRIEPARREIVRDRVELIGSLEPRSTVEVRAATAGYVVKLPFDLGDAVKAGDVVAELDDATAREGVSQAEAALKVAQARLKAQIATAEHARTELDRWQRLAKTGVSTGQQLDAAQAAVAVAEAQADLERAQIEQVTAQLDQAKLQLEQTRIRAPADGFVATRLVSVGHLATTDLALLRLVTIDTVHTVVHVPEQDYQRIRTGQTAKIAVDALPGRTFEGTVVRKAPVLDPATRTAAVEVEIPNEKYLLKPGMHARVAVVFDERESVVVPLAALREDHRGHAVYVVSGDPPIARRVEVETGVLDGDHIEIRSGLDTEAMVVTLGQDAILEDGPVQPVGRGRAMAEQPTRAESNSSGPG